jgi:type II secretory pathway pseudopilin PulG
MAKFQMQARASSTKLLDRQRVGQNQGFSMVEAIAGLVVASVLIGVTGPMFVAQRQENINSELMSGAKSVATRCMELMRRQDLTQLTVSDDYNSATPACDIPAAERTQMGQEFQVATRIRMVTLDPGSLVAANGDGQFQCGGAGSSATTGSRCVSVRVFWKGKVMYAVNSVYASLGQGTGVNQ